MPPIRSVRRVTVAVLAGLALSTTATVATAESAAESVSVSGQNAATLCNVNQNTWVRILPGFSGVIGTIPAGGGFRIDGATPAYADGLWWWYGHGSDWVRSGWVPDQNLTNCH